MKTLGTALKSNYWSYWGSGGTWECQWCRKRLERGNDREHPIPRQEYKHPSTGRSKVTSQFQLH
jgi:hypothetical protein